MPTLALTELLASYVPKLIQNRVIANPAPIESPVSEDLQAAVLFADISGFTLLTERMAETGPTGVETLARILNEYFGQLIDIIHDYGGDAVKFAKYLPPVKESEECLLQIKEIIQVVHQQGQAGKTQPEPVKQNH